MALAKTVRCSWFMVGVWLLVLPACDRSGAQASGSGPSKAICAPGEPVQDTDGNLYPTIRIGQQIWMAENLKKTKFECVGNRQATFTNGIERGPQVKFYDGSPRYAYYNNKKDLEWGVLYNYALLQHCDVCPPGYKIPTKSDWETLIRALGGNSIAGKHLLTNGASGFNAKLSGRIDGYGSVMGGSIGCWWSANLDSILANEKPHALVCKIFPNGLVQIGSEDMRVGNSVRCIKK